MDWREHYENANTPWDLAEAHPELVRRLDAGSLQPSGGSVLVPGCGTGEDARALARAGFVVTALDRVGLLESQLQPFLAQHGGRFVCTDGLAYRQVHDALFEHTFFCAIPPERRADYAEMAAACVRPGGHIYAIVFPIGKQPHDQGPPFHMTSGAYAASLAKDFDPVEDAPIQHSVRGGPWQQRWAVLRRR